MADIKESAMTQKSDCKWVRALDANGNSIRISKEDLASVVGGLLNYKTIIEKTTQVEDVVTLSQGGIAIGILAHYNDEGRTSEIAILKRTLYDGVYSVERITEKTNTGNGFTVASDGLSIKCNGAASIKSVYIIALRGTAVFK